MINTLDKNNNRLLHVTILTFLLGFLMLSVNLNAQIQYVTSVGDYSDDVGTAVASDASGNIYSTGYFVGTIDVDPGPGVHNITSSTYSYKDMYLLKLDSSGNFLWAIQTSNDSLAYCASSSSSIIIESNGTVCVAGSFYGKIDFDPGAGVYDLSGNTYGSNESGFLLKLDASGNFISAACFRSLGSGIVRDLKIDSDTSGNVYIAGTTYGYVDVDPGPGHVFLLAGGTDDGFVIKLNAANNYVYGFLIGGADKDHSPDIKVSHDGDVYCAGFFSATVDFDPGPGTYNLTTSGSYYGGGSYIFKLNPSGNLVWAKKIDGSSTTWVQSMEIDNNENIYLNGYFNFTSDFDPGPAYYPLTSTSISDPFIEKLDSLGNFSWVKSIKSGAQSLAFAIDSEGGLYFTGGIVGAADFDMGPGICQPPALGGGDVFVYKLDSDGLFVWMQRYGGPGSDQGNELCVVAPNEIAVTGYYNSTASFNTATLTSAGGEDAFLARIRIVANKISGKIFFDMNNNGSFDLNDVPGAGIVLQAGTNSYIPYVDALTADYHIYSDTGSYSLSIANAPDYYVLTPGSYPLSFGSLTSAQDTANDFIFTPISGISDAKVTLASVTDAVQGFNVIYDITYKNVGTDTLSGNIYLKKDTNLIYLGAVPAEQSVMGDSVVWNYSNLLPLEERKISVTLKLTTTVPVGDTIVSLASVTTITADSVPLNNFYTLKQGVKSSHDPNLKTADKQEQLDVSFLATPQYITYTIQFQNTGTSAAVNIFVNDKLDDNNLDISSFEVLSSSHYMNYTMTDNIVCFSFPNILLPAQSVNEPGSHGSVTYRIKTKNTFASGDIINNTADIYFDYNAPIITNTTQHYIVVPLELNEAVFNNTRFVVYPNPSSEKIEIRPLAENVIIRDLFGSELINSKKCNQIDISKLASGIYFISFMNSGGTIIETKKFIKN